MLTATCTFPLLSIFLFYAIIFSLSLTVCISVLAQYNYTREVKLGVRIYFSGTNRIVLRKSPRVLFS